MFGTRTEWVKLPGGGMLEKPVDKAICDTCKGTKKKGGIKCYPCKGKGHE